MSWEGRSDLGDGGGWTCRALYETPRSIGGLFMTYVTYVSPPRLRALGNPPLFGNEPGLSFEAERTGA